RPEILDFVGTNAGTSNWGSIAGESPVNETAARSAHFHAFAIPPRHPFPFAAGAPHRGDRDDHLSAVLRRAERTCPPYRRNPASLRGRLLPQSRRARLHAAVARPARLQRPAYGA